VRCAGNRGSTLNDSVRNIRLLQPVGSSSSPEAKTIELCGRLWEIREYAQLPDDVTYTCISYVWGREKTENSFDHRQLMSHRTIPVVKAAIRASQSSNSWANVQFKDSDAKARVLGATNAYWVDALCTPVEVAARTTTLLSMGKIYSSAKQVFIVLSASSAGVLHQIRDTGGLDASALSIIENDPWITRSWTYQEIVNSTASYFMAEDDESIIVSGVDFLDAILTAADDYRSINGIDSVNWRLQHPTLDSLECLIADYKIANYAERSAYQALTAMSMRLSERTEDHFYSMIGAITKSSPCIPIDGATSPSEYFMKACEEKGDYSFIYTAAPRNTTLGRRWRPIEGKFPPIVVELVIFGDGQSGIIHPTHIELTKWPDWHPAPLGPEGLKATKAHLAMVHRNRPVANIYSIPGDIAAAILELIRARGFSGSGHYLEVENGFFFPQSESEAAGDAFIALSTEVYWQGGGPGMLLRPSATGLNDFCDVGVFFGRVPKAVESVNVR